MQSVPDFLRRPNVILSAVELSNQQSDLSTYLYGRNSPSILCAITSILLAFRTYSFTLVSSRILLACHENLLIKLRFEFLALLSTHKEIAGALLSLLPDQLFVVNRAAAAI